VMYVRKRNICPGAFVSARPSRRLGFLKNIAVAGVPQLMNGSTNCHELSSGDFPRQGAVAGFACYNLINQHSGPGSHPEASFSLRKTVVGLSGADFPDTFVLTDEVEGSEFVSGVVQRGGVKQIDGR